MYTRRTLSAGWADVSASCSGSYKTILVDGYLDSLWVSALATMDTAMAVPNKLVLSYTDRVFYPSGPRYEECPQRPEDCNGEGRLEAFECAYATQAQDEKPIVPEAEGVDIRKYSFGYRMQFPVPEEV